MPANSPRMPADGVSSRAANLVRALEFIRKHDGAMLDVALAYAVLGIPVFPCCPNRKSPLVPGESAPGKKDGGLYLATINETQVRAWWKRWPRAMVGVPMGEASGLVAIDLDPGKVRLSDELSEQLLTKLLEQLRSAVGGKLPAGLVAHTPRGGMHLFYAMPAGVEIGNRANLFKAAKGEAMIDVRGTGGYVIFAPSQRRGSSGLIPTFGTLGFERR